MEALRLYSTIMVAFFGYSAWKDADYPTTREANDCFLYNSDAVDKRDAGYYIYGAVTYVLNPRAEARSRLASDTSDGEPATASAPELVRTQHGSVAVILFKVPLRSLELCL